jgi:C4-dicarboxylate-specific signal transduction histidine kinase
LCATSIDQRDNCIGAKRNHQKSRLGPDPAFVHSDRVQLQQVVLNLTLNPAEAMGSIEGEPRELLISTEQHRKGVEWCAPSSLAPTTFQFFP